MGLKEQEHEAKVTLTINEYNKLHTDMKFEAGIYEELLF